MNSVVHACISGTDGKGVGDLGKDAVEVAEGKSVSFGVEDAGGKLVIVTLGVGGEDWVGLGVKKVAVGLGELIAFGSVRGGF